MDFRDYKTARMYAPQINAGYSSRLFGLERDSNPETDEGKRLAWWHGWDKAVAWENRNASCQANNHLLQDGWTPWA